MSYNLVFSDRQIAEEEGGEVDKEKKILSKIFLSKYFLAKEIFF